MKSAMAETGPEICTQASKSISAALLPGRNSGVFLQARRATLFSSIGPILNDGIGAAAQSMLTSRAASITEIVRVIMRRRHQAKWHGIENGKIAALSARHKRGGDRYRENTLGGDKRRAWRALAVRHCGDAQAHK